MVWGMGGGGGGGCGGCDVEGGRGWGEDGREERGLAVSKYPPLTVVDLAKTPMKN